MKRGACPSVRAPMQTGDGLLARLMPAGSGASRAAWLTLCDAAERHGNGITEVTSRGSLQIRGLRPETVPAFAAEVTANNPIKNVKLNFMVREPGRQS